MLYTFRVRYKYTNEEIQRAVQQNASIAGVLRSLKMKIAGGSYRNIKLRIKKACISTAHFTGQGHNIGRHPPNRKDAKTVLIDRTTTGERRCHAAILRRALLESGSQYECAVCRNTGTWALGELILEIDHIDGNWLDDRLHNLRFLCPNCHSQTATFRNKRRNSPTVEVRVSKT